jgi:GNAT superfamily N-acetyltransferase
MFHCGITFPKRPPDLKINLHVVPPNHGFIGLNLCFRDYLRNNEIAKLAYEKLKYKLAINPINFERAQGGFPRYTLEKDAFIKSILNEANYGGFMINFCTHNNEWESYHHLKEKLLFAPLGIKYDRKHPTVHADNHYHLVLYSGTIIVSIAHIEMLGNEAAVLRSLATDTPFQSQGYGAHLLKFIECWLRNKGIKTVKTHAELTAENFYRKLGYVDIEFDDISISNTILKLGKTL